MMSVYLTPLGLELGNLHVTAHAGVPSAGPGQGNSVSFLHSSQLGGVRRSGGPSIGLVPGKMLV